MKALGLSDEAAGMIKMIDVAAASASKRCRTVGSDRQDLGEREMSVVTSSEERFSRDEDAIVHRIYELSTVKFGVADPAARPRKQQSSSWRERARHARACGH